MIVFVWLALSLIIVLIIVKVSFSFFTCKNTLCTVWFHNNLYIVFIFIYIVANVIRYIIVIVYITLCIIIIIVIIYITLYIILYIATVNIIVIVTEFLFTEINLCSEQSVCPMNSNCSMVSPGRFNCLCQEGFIMNHLSVCEGNFCDNFSSHWMLIWWQNIMLYI